MQSRIMPDIVQNQTLCTMAAADTVDSAARQMDQHNVAAVIVLGEEEELVGIVTERDITRRVVGRNRDPHVTKLSEIMTANPDILSPTDTAADALERMRAGSYRHMPVVDGDRVVGMVSIRDLYAAVQKTLEDDLHETEAFVFGDRYGVA